MSLNVHVATIGFVKVDVNGNAINMNTATIAAVASGSSDNRVIPDPNIPNSAGYPTISTYLNAEYASGYKLLFIGPNMIITSQP